MNLGVGIRQAASVPIAWCLLLISCMPPHRESFRVLPRSPNYLLQDPDSRETPFPDILRVYNGFERGRSWIDLRPMMSFRIENAYYAKGASRRGLDGFLGTEVARYEMKPGGLHLLSFVPMRNRPDGDTAAKDLISAPRLKFRYQRLYYEIVFARKNNEHGSVLLAADSVSELDALSTRLTQPETVCAESSAHCTVFPEACSVSVEMTIFVNDKPQTVIWGSGLESVIQGNPLHLELKRLYAGRLRPVKMNSQDPVALRIPLLPGDHVNWN